MLSANSPFPGQSKSQQHETGTWDTWDFNLQTKSSIFFLDLRRYPSSFEIASRKIQAYLLDLTFLGKSSSVRTRQVPVLTFIVTMK